jgi:Zn-dependent protease with chaperone function
MEIPKAAPMTPRQLLLAATLALLATLPPVSFAQAAPPAGAAHSLAAAPADSLASSGRDSVAGSLGDRAAAGAVVPAPPAPRDYLAEARAAYTPVNRSYQNTRVVLQLVGPLYGLVITLLLLFTGLSARFRDIAHALGHRLYVRVLVYFVLFATTSAILGLPLAWFEEFALEHQYGLSNQTLGGWFSDSAKGLVFLLVVVGVIPILHPAWRIVTRSPRGWWWRLAAAVAPLTLAATLLQPVVFEPLFNKFEPLRDPSLSREILALGRRAGIPARQVFQVDMSRRTKKLNAYVSGFGASQRIVLWDTTIEAMRRDEILVVMGHEMGHYVLNHVWKSIVVIGLGAFAAFWLAARIVEWLLRAFGLRWGVAGVDDLASLPVFSLALTVVTLLAQPGLNALSRGVEHESDAYTLELTHDNDAAARAFLKLAQDNRSNPEPAPWVRVLLYDHPALADRIRFALEYRPWERGEPNRYYRGR